jgi:hypothetical protein
MILHSKKMDLIELKLASCPKSIFHLFSKPLNLNLAIDSHKKEKQNRISSDLFHNFRFRVSRKANYIKIKKLKHMQFKMKTKRIIIF